MTDSKSDITSLAKQGNSRAIATLMNQSLQPKGITAKVALKDGCLQIMLESTQVPNQTSLVAFIKKGVTSLGISSVERVKVYGKQSGEEFPAWNQEFELIEPNIPNNFFVLEENDNKKNQLQTDSAKNVLEQFMNLRARTSIGISYNDFPSILGLAKLAVQKFERSPDSKVCPYLTEIIQKIMFYYEVSLECLGYIASAILVKTLKLEQILLSHATLESFSFVCGCDFLAKTNNAQSYSSLENTVVNTTLHILPL